MTLGAFQIVFAPLLPVMVLQIMALAAALLALFALFRRARGSVLRSLVLALLLLVLANPSIIVEQREPLKDTAVLVIDDSASMQIGDRAAQSTKAAEAISKKLAAFSDLDVETVHVKGDSETDLFHALAPKVASIPQDRLAGIIVLTDGEIEDKPDRNIPAPFHAVIAGHHDEIDRRMTVKQAPAYGIVGKQVTLTLRVEDAPKAQSDMAAVTFRLDDGSSQSMKVPVGKDVSITVPINHPGQNMFAFEVEPLPNELTALNNSTAVTVNGVRDRLRVLLVSGEPHIGGRTWRNFLKADPAVDLVHFTILRSPMKENFVSNNELALIAFPVNELFAEKLKTFDLIIFDRFSNRSLVPDVYLENIAHYVENGGALLISSATDDIVPAAQNISGLSHILPAQPTGKLLTGSFVPDVTAVGKRHPVTSVLTTDAPRSTWGPWFRQIDAQVVKGDVLMSGLNGQPLLVLDHVGQGRVAQFLSDQFWLWSRNYAGGGPQAELLRRVAHWLVQEPQLDETALHAQSEFVDGHWQLSIAKQSLRDDTAAVSVNDPQDRPVQVKLTNNNCAGGDGILCATLPVKDTGLYRVKDDAQEILVMVGPMDAPEFGAMIATEDKLSPIAKASGGGIDWLADHPDGPDIRRTDANGMQSGHGWIGLRKNGQYRVTGSTATSLWPAWAALAVLLAVMMLAWRREGKS